MEEKYLLPNRDNFTIYLRKKIDNIYFLDCKDKYLTFRIIGDRENIKAIDPSGGPMLYKGYVVTNNIFIEDIFYDNGYYFKLSENLEKKK